jgi:hypothetical protein
MITLIYLIAACVLTGSFLMVRGLRSAPEGYQDDLGFHFKGRPALARVDVLASTACLRRDNVGHVAGSIA